jgi:predicted N-acetyltransferase YhbS
MPAQLKLIDPAPPETRAPINAEAAVRVAVEQPEDAPAACALADRAFGPGRYAKVSERVREGAGLRPDLSFCAFGAGVLVGTVRLWSVRVGGAPGLFLGPIAVEGGWRKHRIGGRLVEACCTAAAAAGEPFILLVGDMPFFGPYGFAPAPAGRVVLPGPVDRRRILWRALREDGLEGVQGAVCGARPGDG